MSTAIVPVTVADSRTVPVRLAASDAPVRAYPQEITLFGRVHANYNLVEAVTLIVERDEDGSFVVSDDVFAVYGHAFRLVDALRDYISALAEYYELLSEHEDAPSLALLQELKRYLQPIR